MKQLRALYYAAWAARSRAYYGWCCGELSEGDYRAADRAYRTAGNEYVEAIRLRRSK